MLTVLKPLFCLPLSAVPVQGRYSGSPKHIQTYFESGKGFTSDALPDATLLGLVLALSVHCLVQPSSGLIP